MNHDTFFQLKPGMVIMDKSLRYLVLGWEKQRNITRLMVCPLFLGKDSDQLDTMGYQQADREPWSFRRARTYFWDCHFHPWEEVKRIA